MNSLISKDQSYMLNLQIKTWNDIHSLYFFICSIKQYVHAFWLLSNYLGYKNLGFKFSKFFSGRYLIIILRFDNNLLINFICRHKWKITPKVGSALKKYHKKPPFGCFILCRLAISQIISANFPILRFINGEFPELRWKISANSQIM